MAADEPSKASLRPNGLRRFQFKELLNADRPTTISHTWRRNPCRGTLSVAKNRPAIAYHLSSYERQEFDAFVREPLIPNGETVRRALHFSAIGVDIKQPLRQEPFRKKILDI
jgi:hypothetical protein